MRREFVIFDVSADLAHFRRQYTITTALTYPIPTRTALCGLVGAVLGLPKNESLDYFGDDDAVFALQLLHPIKTGHVSLNLVQTKDNKWFRLKGENPRTTVRYEVIWHPMFRIMFSHAILASKLAEALSSGESVYTPCLGLAWMIAWFRPDWHTRQAELVTNDTDARNFISPVRSDDVQGDIQWKPSGLYQRVRLPAVMRPDRQVTRYESYIIDTTGNPIETALKSYWRLNDGTCFSAM